MNTKQQLEYKEMLRLRGLAIAQEQGEEL